MPRISLSEQYDNKDVLTQIYRMLDQVATGTFQSVDVQRVGGDYVFTFTDQNGDPQQFTVSADYVADVNMTRLNGVYTFTFTYAGGTTESFAFTVNGVQNIASVQSGSTVTVTFTLDDGTTKTISYTAGGDMTTDTAQTVTAVKTFTASPLVPSPPSGSTDQTVPNTNWISQTGDGSPNNLVHRLGNETMLGQKTVQHLSVTGLYGNKSMLIGPDTPGYYRFYKGNSASSTGHSIMLLFMNGKGYSANDRNNLAIMMFTSRPSTSVNAITPVFQGSFQTAGAYAMTFDSDGYPEIWVHVVSGMASAANHGVGAIRLAEMANTVNADTFLVSDGYFMTDADFATAYPTAVYSS